MPDLPPPVVVGVDTSQTALRAVRFAADEARLRYALLRLVHAHSWPLDGMAIPPTDLDLHGQLQVGAATVVQLAVDAVAGMPPTAARRRPSATHVAGLQQPRGAAPRTVPGGRRPAESRPPPLIRFAP